MKNFKIIALAVFCLFKGFNGVTQIITITGSVKDAVTKQPISGVSVYIRGGKGVSTDSLGNYTISTDREMIPLVFSIIDYRAQTIIVKKNENRVVKQLDVYLD